MTCSLPTAAEVFAFLEQYCVDASIVSSTWVETRRDRFIVPYVERITGMSVSSIKTAVEYYSGNGKNILVLNRKPIIEVLEIKYVLGGQNFVVLNLGNIETDTATGVLKAKRNYEEAYYLPVFAKGDWNIKVTYTYGYASIPEDIKEAIIYLITEQLLGYIGAQTGGGSLSVQAYSRNYGDRGTFTDIRNDLSRQAHSILNKYGSAGVVGA